MHDHYTLEVLVSEHQYELRGNADNYRLLQKGQPTTTAALRAKFGRIADHLACLFSGWRYRMLMGVGTVPQAEPCS
jgi:hypothetical protein